MQWRIGEEWRDPATLAAFKPAAPVRTLYEWAFTDMLDIEDAVSRGDLPLAHSLCQAKLDALRRIEDDIVRRMSAPSGIGDRGTLPEYLLRSCVVEGEVTDPRHQFPSSMGSLRRDHKGLMDQDGSLVAYVAMRRSQEGQNGSGGDGSNIVGVDRERISAEEIVKGDAIPDEPAARLK